MPGSNGFGDVGAQHEKGCHTECQYFDAAKVQFFLLRNANPRGNFSDRQYSVHTNNTNAAALDPSTADEGLSVRNET